MALIVLLARADPYNGAKPLSGSPVKRRQSDRIRSFIFTYWPVLSSFLFLAATIAVARVVSSEPGDAVRTPDCDCAGAFVGTREWQVWIGTVSAGLAIASVLAIHGFVRLKRLPSQWPERCAVGRVEVLLHSVLALVWVHLLGWAVKRLVDAPRTWPLDMEGRLQWVAIIGLTCAAPWVALTWLSHKAVHPYWVDPYTLRKTLEDPKAPNLTASEADALIAELQQIWNQIVGVALAFATLVAVSLIPTGALRNLWLSMDVEGEAATKRLEASFTVTDVLLYGAMWALLAALVVIPLVASWRSTAQSVVDAAYPPNATTAANEQANKVRESLESMLNLRSGILRNPLTILTIATPLVTAATAAFVPQIGK